jgi:hypothetical protein
MESPQEFRNYATSCQSMARISNDPDSKAVWVRMAERWILCAKLAEEQERCIRVERDRQPRGRGSGFLLGVVKFPFRFSMVADPPTD